MRILYFFVLLFVPPRDCRYSRLLPILVGFILRRRKRSSSPRNMVQRILRNILPDGQTYPTYRLSANASTRVSVQPAVCCIPVGTEDMTSTLEVGKD
jgi:hypothetical protein